MLLPLVLTLLHGTARGLPLTNSNGNEPNNALSYTGKDLMTLFALNPLAKVQMESIVLQRRVAELEKELAEVTEKVTHPD
jgi:hypothetical protein